MTAKRSQRARRPIARHNPVVALAGRRDPDIRLADRAFWILFRRFWSGWAASLAIVEPETVVRWHRAGFRIYCNWLSGRGDRSGRPPLPREARALIRRMATENPWGAPRIHGELLRLGWTTFLRNHRNGIAAMDFFTVPTAMFRVLHVFLVFRHGRRDVVRCAVTTSPTAAWVASSFATSFRSNRHRVS